MEEAGDEPLFCERAAGIGIGKQLASVTIRVPGDTRKGGPPRQVIAVGDKISLVKQSLEHLRGQGIDDQSALTILDQIQREKKGVRVRIEYIDIFGNEMEPVDYVI